MSKDTALVFPGQGSQIVGMGKDLYDNFGCAKDVFETIDQILNIKLSKIIFDGPSEELTKTQNAQPALMAVSIALMEVLEKEFGKKITDLCSFAAGHSLGEYSALCAAKSISLEDATRLLQVRGNAMAKCGKNTSGAMAAIIGVEIKVVEEIAKLAAKNNQICQVANDNSIGQVVISGSKIAIEQALIIAKEKGAKRALLLPVSGAFHSDLMQEAAIQMKEILEKTNINPPIVPIIANISANIVNSSEQIKGSLIKQITGSVRWRETMIFLEKNNIKQVIEVGSGKVLSGLVKRTCPELSSKSIQNVSDIDNSI